eukprot:TRINITY_DN10267_c0_g1_i1.p1 TRINITY_DN10267_c0_g1~~TRINITY_DN10267_c0_g1_i1.p1  ORF type:complete len:520 (+),score=191.95 TRINITY_DN10267_c0_g1_i1:33-1592(+)
MSATSSAPPPGDDAEGVAPQHEGTPVRVDGDESGEGEEQVGQVTVFSISGCPHCRTAKNSLKEKGLKYVEVNLDVFPERKQEMKELSGRHTLPQILFNNIHVGGNDDLQSAMADETRWQELLQEVRERHPEGVPQPPPAHAMDASSSDVCSAITECTPDLHLELVKKMRGPEGIAIQDRMYHLKTYPQVFVGSQLVDWLVKERQCTRKEAVDLGNEMLEKHFFHHVCDDHVFKDKYLFYRFLHDEKKQALNVQETSMCEPMPALDLAEKLRRLIIALYDEHLSPDGKVVDYAGIARSEGFRRYALMTTRLQRTDLSSLSREERMAFFINIYNALVIHAYVEKGPPRTSWQRLRFFTRMSYKIGGQNFSLNDIEHGVLRGNRRFGLALYPPFHNGDPRADLVIKDVDPRLHFALVCGAKGCPPIKTYNAAQLNDQLEDAALAFFAGDSVEYNEKRNRLRVSMILKWYGGDFGPNEKAVGAFVAKYVTEAEKKAAIEAGMQRSGFKISYFDYDWEVNGKFE